MTSHPDFASRLVDTIRDRELTPRPRWEFILRQIVMASLVLVTIILGALTVAMSEFLLIDRDWDLSLAVGQRNALYMIQSLPYLWFSALLLLLVMSYYLITRTRRGYRFAPVTIIGGTVVISIALGSALYVIGIAPHTHQYFRAYVPGYEHLVITRDQFWAQPQRGFLRGVVEHTTSSREFSLRDTRGALWQVTVTGSSEGVVTGSPVRMVGSPTEYGFIAATVVPWREDESRVMR